MPAPLITIDEARERIRAAIPAPLGTQEVTIERALDRVLRQDIRARHDSPPFTCSAMDGYALATGESEDSYRIVGESRAGRPFAGRLGPGDAVRISTGAPVPAEARAVIRQEDTAVAGETLRALAPVRDRQNIRGSGEDRRSGETILAAGIRLGPSELAATISAGHGDRVLVAKRPAVSIVTTGDELRAAGETLEPGAIHNSNGPMLRLLALRAGAATGQDRLVADDPQATEDALREAIADCDVMIVTGGVSVGPHDHVKPALAALGVEQRFWGVALQPGKPTWFGTRAERLVFGLPGNPVSAAVTFSLFVVPALEALLGATPRHRPLQTATLATSVPRSAMRDRLIRVRLRQEADRVLAEPTGPQDSHLISSLGAADALGFVPRGDEPMAAGDLIALEALPGE